ncbi:hypothetical protein [Staphylococcus phage SpP]
MTKKLIIKNEVVEMTFEEVLELFTPLIYKEINRQKSIFNRVSEEREDMYQDASLYLFKAYEKYDIEKGYHFTTFARRYVQRGVQNMTRENQMQKRDGVTVSMDQQVKGEEGSELVNFLVDDTDMDNPIIAQEVIEQAFNIMSETEAESLKCILKGMTRAEIAHKKGITRQNAYAEYKRVEDKIRLVATKYQYCNI